MNALNIVFAGTPAFALPCLQALFDSKHQVRAVYTQPDRPAGRGRKLQASPVKEWAQANHIPVYQPLHFKSQDAIDELAALKPDIMVVIAYGLILPESVLTTPRLGCINVHASLLPRWRGASPIQHAILGGDKRTGVTIMQMDKGMDTGDILSMADCEISETDTAASLHDKLSELAIKPLLSTLSDLSQSKGNPQSQEDELATYAPKINKLDALINWTHPAEVLDRMIRAYYPWPIAYTHAGDLLIKIHQSRISPETSKHPAGTVLKLDKQGMTVATGDQALLIERLQFPGKRPMLVSEWLNAGRADLQPGMVLE